MKRDLAIIGASYLQLPLIEKAKEMGYTTHVFAWAANDVGEIAADHFYPISIVEKGEILDKCREIGICGITSIASDLAAITVNYVADAMGLVGNSMEATFRSTNKHAMRNAFFAAGDPSPKSILIDESTDLDGLDLDFPVIVKPTDRSGSRGICKLYDRAGLREAVESAAKESFEKKVLIEEFAEGQEYSVEYISFRGEHHFLAVTLKYTTGEPHFIETGHREPAPVDADTLKRIQEVVPHALDTLGIENGASHSEVKIDENGTIRIIEIGGRMGGDCIGSDLVYWSTGVDFVKAVIQVACGEAPDLTPQHEPVAVESVFIFTPDDMAEFERLQRDEPDRLIRLVDLDLECMGHTTDSSNRAGCYIRKV
ncbi:MAG: ATP-grasp domain-containing protein [Mogibacterium sp.]|nr:ATP-grasp domain-containing protein [Mogibacterium sp.]